MKYLDRLIKFAVVAQFLISAACSSIPKDYNGKPLEKYGDKISFFHDPKQSSFFLYVVVESQFDIGGNSRFNVSSKGDSLSMACTMTFWEIAEKFAKNEKRSIMKEATLVQTNVQKNYCTAVGHVQTLSPTASLKKWDICKKNKDCALYHDYCGAPKSVNKNFLEEYKKMIDGMTGIINCNNFVAGTRPEDATGVGVKCKNFHCTLE